METKPDVIVAFAFGKFENNFHSPNLSIGQRAIAKAIGNRNHLPIITQEDVFLNEKLITLYRLEIYDIKEIPGKYLSTLGIIRKMMSITKEKRWKSILVIAAPPYEWRCMKDLRKMGFEVIKDDYLKHYSSSFWYRKDSLQLWTRSWWKWWFREIPLRILNIFWWKMYEKIST